MEPITTSLATNPVINAAEACQSSNPAGANTGATASASTPYAESCTSSTCANPPVPATTGMPCNSHSAVIVEMMITLAPRMKPHSRIKVTIRMTYGFHHVSSLIALVMLRCGGLDIHLPQPRT